MSYLLDIFSFIIFSNFRELAGRRFLSSRSLWINLRNAWFWTAIGSTVVDECWVVGGSRHHISFPWKELAKWVPMSSSCQALLKEELLPGGYTEGFQSLCPYLSSSWDPDGKKEKWALICWTVFPSSCGRPIICEPISKDFTDQLSAVYFLCNR